MALSSKGLTYRALGTGFVLGAILAPCNIYTGLKTGFSINISIVAALLSFGFWNGLHRFGLGRPWGIFENNINQTAASSAGNILSAGLVAPIPALALISGRELAYPVLAVWVFVVSFLGVVTALAVRRQLIEREALPFPTGVATAETLREMYAHGREASRRVIALISAAVLAGLVKLISLWTTLPTLAFPERWGFSVPERGLSHVSWRDLGIELQLSLMYIGFGAIVGPVVGISLLIGTIVAWMALPPWLLAQGWVDPAGSGVSWYEAMLDWLLWPGVSLMVGAALTSAGIAIARTLLGGWSSSAGDATEAEDPDRQFPLQWLVMAAIVGLLLTVVAQMWIFGISWWLAVVAALLSFVLSVVAGRVSGETGIPPIGALGKVTQVTFGFLAPGNVTNNLMAANVTGGASGQCSDLLHDLKTGRILGASLKAQAAAQLCGIFAGALFGSLAYLVIIPDPQSMLLTPEWPAPAVATWKAVAEVMAGGLGKVPSTSLWAAAIAGVLGIGLAVLDAVLPSNRRKWVPSASSLGFAFIIPPFISLAIFVGSMITVFLGWVRPGWKRQFALAVAAGLVAGESLTGVISAIRQILLP